MKKAIKHSLENKDKTAPELVGGNILNPDWVEWLMDFPRGWTRLEKIQREDVEDWMEKNKTGTWFDVDPADVDEIPRTTSINDNRRVRLVTLGNAQVPATIVLANAILDYVSRRL